jgi:hypothetical protein
MASLTPFKRDYVEVDKVEYLIPLPGGLERNRNTGCAS